MNELLGKFSERIEIKRFDVLKSEDGFIADYVHNGDKLGVLVELSAAGEPEPTGVMARDIAMQIAAMNPSYVRREETPENVIAKEKEIYSEQAAQEGKPAEIAAKIAAGRLEKFFGDACLIEQSFVKDSSKVIKDVLADFSKGAGKDVTVVRFMRYNLGEVTPN
jgi:elongation factor Ts